MKNKFLGIISITYSLLITYVFITGNLKNYLAPTMQKYIIASILPLLIIGVVILKEKHSHYKFKLTDLILLLPIVMIILSSDGRLTTKLAANRTINPSKTTIKEKHQKKKNAKVAKEPINTDEIYFDVKDEIYSELANYLTFEENAKKYEGKTIKVKGFIAEYESGLPKDYYAIGKYGVSCCIADASFVGFYVKNNSDTKLEYDKWYEVEGVLENTKGKYNESLTIIPTKITEVDGKKEEQYIYPCFNYGDGTCPLLQKYDLDY
ncbi:MAG: TIGR03943 family protein [Firmicutes bacterium]|nr:TIGR03943 family protein [Bacillota bacterium]